MSWVDARGSAGQIAPFRTDRTGGDDARLAGRTYRRYAGRRLARLWDRRRGDS